MIGLQNKYLRMDGLAFKVVPFQGQTISASKLHQNLFEKFKYRHLGDPSVFYDSNIQNLLQNYRSAFLRLADNYSQYGTKEQVAQVIDKMEESVPSSTIPMRDAYFNIFIGKLYQEAGQTEKAKKYLDIASSYKMDADDKLNLGWMYMEFMKDYKMSEKIFKDILLNDPDNIKAVSALVRVYERTENYQEGANLMQDWLTRHPGDETALEKLNEFRAKLSAGSTSEDGK
jgi:tetratricopeptide (TPR) repeat protein